MFEFDYAHHIPSIVAGVVVGLLAFAPLLVALVPVLRRQREANMTVGSWESSRRSSCCFWALS